MADKKYKPALFELVKKGSKDPQRSLETPKWFYGKQNNAPQDDTGGAQAESTEPGDETQNATPMLWDTAEAEPPGPGRIRMTVPLWLAALAIAAVVVMMLACWRLGYNSGAADQQAAMMAATETQPPNRAESTPPTASESVRPQTPVTVTQPAVSAKPVEPTVAVTTPATPAAPVEGQCLIMCSADSARKLRAVQAYFTTHGIGTHIGRFGGQYVLISAELFDSSRSVSADQLKDVVARLGDGYNNWKTRNDPVFSAKTFESAYWVRNTNIDMLDE